MITPNSCIEYVKTVNVDNNVHKITERLIVRQYLLEIYVTETRKLFDLHNRKWLKQCKIVLSKTYTKYQGVKEFHMLGRIGCYCKIMVFSPLKLEVTYYHSSKAIKP